MNSQQLVIGEVSDRPIIFSGAMVRAVLDGKKTQTRRVITAANSTVLGYGVTKTSTLWTGLQWSDKRLHKDGGFPPYSTPFEYLHVPWRHADEPVNEPAGRIYRVYCKFEPGDRLWVKETWAEQSGDIYYKAEWPHEKPVNMALDNIKWRPSIFMPRWASRLTLEITGVRVQRIQEISEEDIIAEGCPKDYLLGLNWFRPLWDSLNTKRGHSWETNVRVWCLTFKMLRQEVPHA